MGKCGLWSQPVGGEEPSLSITGSVIWDKFCNVCFLVYKVWASAPMPWLGEG